MGQLRAYTLFLSVSACLVQAELPFSNSSSQTGAAAIATIAHASSTKHSHPIALAMETSAFPIASVPPTSQAPFMQKSTLPENFIFILAGSIIGSFFVSICLWRALLARSIKRSAKRAYHPYQSIKKEEMGTLQKFAHGIRGGPGLDKDGFLNTQHLPFYSQGLGSDMSLGLLKGKDIAKSLRQESNRSSMFFSPTSGVEASSTNSTAANRSLSFLPSRYHAAGNSISGSPVSGGERPVSMVDMTNQSMQYFPLPLPRGLRGSSSDSPSHRSRAEIDAESMVGNVSLDPRAPSTYLQDLFNIPLEDAGSSPRQRGR